MPGKYKKSSEIIHELEKNNYKIFKYSYIQSKLVYIYFKLKSTDFKGSKLKEFTFKRMSSDEMKSIISSSNIIIDCPKKGQSGLTIRTFEALAANKKLITTNKTIINYDFYRPENIYVFDKFIDFNNIFFNSDFIPIEKKVKDNYSIDAWIRKILSNYKRGNNI